MREFPDPGKYFLLKMETSRGFLHLLANGSDKGGVKKNARIYVYARVLLH